MAQQSNSVFTVNTDNKYVVEIREIKNIEEARLAAARRKAIEQHVDAHPDSAPLPPAWKT